MLTKFSKMQWYVVIVILCIYGFIKEFRPSEPFLTPYLTSSYKNISNDDLSSRVYPVSTYSSFFWIIPVLILCDPLRYKVLVIYESLAYASCWALLLWADTIPLMQLMQFFYGSAGVSQVAYYSYIYAYVETQHYQRVTSVVRASVLMGDFFSYGLSQLLVSVFHVSYVTLNYVSFVSMCVIVFVAFLLPWVSWKSAKSLSTYSDDSDNKSAQGVTEVSKKPKNYFEYLGFYFKNLWSNFRGIYSTTFMWKWSLWWAMASCGFYQIGNYTQNLWETMQTDTDVYNGVVECVNTFLSALVVFLMQFIHIRWEIWGEITMAVVATLDCAVLIIMSQTYNLILSYCCYSLTRIMYQFMIAIAMFNVAKRLKTENYGLVFGFNTWIALLLQTVLTIVVPGEHGLDLDIRTQFIVYGGYHGLIAVIFFVMGVITLCNVFSEKKRIYELHEK